MTAMLRMTPILSFCWIIYGYQMKILLISHALLFIIVIFHRSPLFPNGRGSANDACTTMNVYTIQMTNDVSSFSAHVCSWIFHLHLQSTQIHLSGSCCIYSWWLCSLKLSFNDRKMEISRKSWCSWDFFWTS